MIALTICRLLEVDVSVTQGLPGDHVATDPDGEDRSGHGELFEQHGFGNVRGQVPNVEGGHLVVDAAATSTLRLLLLLMGDSSLRGGSGARDLLLRHSSGGSSCSCCSGGGGRSLGWGHLLGGRLHPG